MQIRKYRGDGRYGILQRETLAEKDVVIVEAESVRSMQESVHRFLVSQFGADTLINTGIAGSLDAQIDVLATWSFPQMRCIMIWILYSVIRQDRSERVDTLSFPADK